MWSLALVPLAAALTFDDLPACGQGPVSPGTNEFYVVAVSPSSEPDAIGGHIALWQRSAALDRDHFWQYGMVRGSNLQLSGIVLAMKLDLPARQRILLQNALTQAKKTDERTAPWDYLDNNCSTAIRDVLDEAFEGQLAASLEAPAGKTLLEDVLRHAGVLPWAWAGLAIGHGAPTDQDLGAWRHAAFSLRLAEHLDTWELNGEPLVTDRCLLLDGNRALPPAEAPDFTGWLALIGLAWAGGLAGLSALPGRAGRVGAACAVGLTSLLLTAAGTVLWILASASTWHGWSPNATLALLQPGWAVGLGAAAVLARGQRKRWLGTTGGLAVVTVLGAPLAAASLGQGITASLALFGPPLVAFGGVLWLRGRPRSG
jgi:hypothetical protein